MCGINGIITKTDNYKKSLAQMNDLVKHRGPDDEGYVLINSGSNSFLQCSGNDSIPYIKDKYQNFKHANLENYDVLFAHRRLSIIDLSENGHCPMSSIDNNIWITFNGEIYNYLELREELENNGFKFRTRTDTEVIINSYIFWGTECLNKFNGMWAFAIWNGLEKKLFLARDRFGVKPLYYTLTNNAFAFSSEMKPLIYFSQKKAELNKDKIPFYLIYGNRLNTNQTYLKDVYSLPSSHFIIYNDNKINITKYYEIPVKSQNSKNDNELKQTIVDIMSDSIKLRFRSDVAVGSCLSGGFDSSSIVSLSKQINKNSLNTFSAVWEEKECDESEYIDIVNSEYGCIPNKIIPKAEEFDNIFDKLTYHQEIPTEGPGLYPQWYVMKSASTKVKVLLDGQGGDEIFGGYLLLGYYLRSLIKDKSMLKIITGSHQFLKFLFNNGFHSFSSWIFPEQYRRFTESNFSKKFKIINSEHYNENDLKILLKSDEPETRFKNFVNNVSYQFIYSQTLPSLLHYEDRSSMAHSIESRVPFLDYRLVELGINLKPEHLSLKGVSRPLYRKALSKYLPGKIISRKDKMGFPTPFSKWTKGILKEMILENLLKPNALINEFIDKKQLRVNLDHHYSGKKDYSWEIWRLLSLEKFLIMYNSKLIF